METGEHAGEHGKLRACDTKVDGDEVKDDHIFCNFISVQLRPEKLSFRFSLSLLFKTCIACIFILLVIVNENKMRNADADDTIIIV